MKVTFYRVVLRTTAPVSVTAPQTADFADVLRARGSAAGDPSEDLPIYRDHRGRPAIPATTLAGSIRAALPPESREAIMGFVSGSRAVASALYVLGGEVSAGEVGLRRSTAIDRTRGAARTHTFHDAQVLEAGATIVVRLEGHDLGGQADVVGATLARWAPRLGRGVSSGQGATELVEVRARTLDLADAESLLTYLNDGGPALVDAVVAASAPLPLAPPEPTTLVDEAFEIVDGVHIGSGEARGNLLMALRRADGRPVMPGSSLKGVLRARCEYILRSIGSHACLDGTCGTCPTCQLFGYSLRESEGAQSLGQRGRLAVRDALIESGHISERAHVAIDRVTGGARDQALYSVELVDQGRIRVLVEALDDPPQWASGLLLAALADIDDGYVGIGGGTTRGQGTLRCVTGPIATRHRSAIREALDTLRTAREEMPDAVRS